MSGPRDKPGKALRRRPERQTGAVAALTLLSFLLLGISTAFAQNQPERTGARGEDEDTFNADRTLVAGSDEMLFAVQLDNDLDEFVLRFAEADALDSLLRGWRADGTVAGIAAWDDTVYLVYNDHSVQAMRWRGTQQPPQPRPFQTRQLPPLPRDGRLLDLVALDDGELLAALTTPSGEDDGDDETPDRQAGGTSADTVTLLRLSRNDWHSVDYPEAASNGQRFVGLGGASAGRGTLITRSAEGDSVTLHTFRDNQPDQPWQSRSYDVAAGDALASLEVRQMRLLLRSESASGPLTIHLARQAAADRLATLESLETAARWWAVPTGDQLVLILVDNEQNLARWAWDLRGEAPSADAFEPIELADMPALTFEPIVWLLVAAMALALLMLLATMGNAEANTPRLPASLRPAGVPRIWAAVIDFVPALLASMMIFSVGDPGEVVRHWPSLSGDWEQMPPAITAIGLHALHTMLAELFTGRSLGKWLTGCRVVDLEGKPPHVWQVIGRNFFKILEMAVPWLLLLPVLPSLLPYQQRLGDLIGRTLVVVDVPEAQQAKTEPETPREPHDEA